MTRDFSTPYTNNGEEVDVLVNGKCEKNRVITTNLENTLIKVWERKEYTDSLEQLVIFLADIYKETSMAIDAERIKNGDDLYRILPIIQGLENQSMISEIADCKELLRNSDDNICYKFDLDLIVKKIQNKYAEENK